MTWISVKDRLPPEGIVVLTYRPNSMDFRMETDYIGLFENGDFTWANTLNSCKHLVTHWMPLPSPPEEK